MKELRMVVTEVLVVTGFSGDVVRRPIMMEVLDLLLGLSYL
jgi:hypothetical protein